MPKHVTVTYAGHTATRKTPGEAKKAALRAAELAAERLREGAKLVTYRGVAMIVAPTIDGWESGFVADHDGIRDRPSLSSHHDTLDEAMRSARREVTLAAWTHHEPDDWAFIAGSRLLPDQLAEVRNYIEWQRRFQAIYIAEIDAGAKPDAARETAHRKATMHAS